MARRRRVLTREDLLHRYATATGSTYGEAHDDHYATEIEELRDLVEGLETTRTEDRPGLRRSYAASQPTTSVQGETTTAFGQTRRAR